MHSGEFGLVIGEIDSPSLNTIDKRRMVKRPPHILRHHNSTGSKTRQALHFGEGNSDSLDALVVRELADRTAALVDESLELGLEVGGGDGADLGEERDGTRQSTPQAHGEHDWRCQ